MPGIVGLVTKMPREQAQAQLRLMVEALRHEPFYETGTWADEALGVYVGWAVPKNSFASGMPWFDETNRIGLFFSGEEYPRPGLVQELKQKGHDVPSEGSSYLVHQAEGNADFLAQLNGRFQGLLIDRDRDTATLFNDRYGMHRLYYHASGDAFYFAAEAKAILAVRPELRTADPQGLGEFVSCGCVLENRTLFRGLHVLPIASAWVFRNRSLQEKGSYFQPSEWENQPTLEEEPYYLELRQAFSGNLPRYFVGPKLGMSLTGGLDTRMIMAWEKAAPGSLPCYSFGGTYRDCQDVLIARKVAQVCRQPHQVIPVGKDFLDRFAHYAERTVYLTDACADVSRCSDLYVNERAAQIAPLRVTGNYGSEVLRRVRAFKPVEPAAGLFQPEFLAHVHATGETYRGLIQGHPLSFAVFRQAPWHHYGLLTLEQTQLSLRSPFLDNDLVRTVFRAPVSALTNDICLRLIADGNPQLRQMRTDRGLAGKGGALAAVSRNLLEFSFKAEYAYDYGMPQWVAQIDHAFGPLHLERLFLGRHKFYHFRVWYRDALAGYVREMLLDPRTLSRPYLQRKTVEEIAVRHTRGDRNYTTAIHKILTLELAHRLFLDGQ